MNNKLVLFLLILCAAVQARAQVMCVNCADQIAAFDSTSTNLILNGSFENTDCLPYTQQWDVFCPNSASYSCDITDWTCINGGSATYTLMYDATTATIPDGNLVAYLGSAFGQLCSTDPQDISCAVDSACQVWGIPAGFPTNAPEYGGSLGVSLLQNVSGLTVGSAYTLEFWAGGENFPNQGVFAVDIGFGYIYFRCQPTPPGAIGTRYAITFIATSTTHQVKFTNWGHLSNTASEVLLDDVRMYQSSVANAPDTFALAQVGCGSEVQCSTPYQPGFTYTWDMGDNTTYDTCVVDHTYSAPGIYPIKLTVTGAGCSGSSVVMDTVTVASLGPDRTICSGDTASWDMSFPGASFVWQDGSTQPTYDATTTGDYWVTISAPGCSFTDTVHVSTLALPVVDLGPDTSLCTGQTWLLDAGNAGATYLWSTSAHTQTLSITTANTYSVAVTDTSHCTGKDTIAITYDPVPVVDLNDTTICVSTSVVFDAGNPGAHYHWSTGDTTRTITVDSLEGTISVSVTNAGWCTGTGSATIDRVDYAVVDLGPDLERCDVLDTVTFDAGNPGSQYAWSTGAHTQQVDVTRTGTYWVDVDNAYCVTRDSVYVIFHPLPDLPLPDDTSACLNYPPYNLVLDARNAGCTYVWNTGAIASELLVDHYGAYTVRITTPFGCSLSDSTTVVEFCPPDIYLPNAFTPDGDGINDRFGPNGNEIATVELSVFDRWGQPVWSGEDNAALWDGTINGEPAKADVYVWRVRYRLVKNYHGALTEGKEAFGHVTLLR